MAVSDSLYYLKQTVNNACGTIAVLHSLANNLDIVAPGGVAAGWLGGTGCMSPHLHSQQPVFLKLPAPAPPPASPVLPGPSCVLLKVALLPPPPAASHYPSSRDLH